MRGGHACGPVSGAVGVHAVDARRRGRGGRCGRCSGGRRGHVRARGSRHAPPRRAQRGFSTWAACSSARAARGRSSPEVGLFELEGFSAARPAFVSLLADPRHDFGAFAMNVSTRSQSVVRVLDQLVLADLERDDGPGIGRGRGATGAAAARAPRQAVTLRTVSRALCRCASERTGGGAGGGGAGAGYPRPSPTRRPAGRSWIRAAAAARLAAGRREARRGRAGAGRRRPGRRSLRAASSGFAVARLRAAVRRRRRRGRGLRGRRAGGAP